MNKVNLIGRICNDLELKQAGENKYTRFSLAVNRKYTKEDGTREADFISCVAWNKAAEIIKQYFKKGSPIGIVGRIQTGSYENDDKKKVYTTDIIVEDFDFLEKKDSRPAPEYTDGQEAGQQNGQQEEPPSDPYADFANEVTITDDDLPF